MSQHESSEHAVVEIERGSMPGWVEIHVKKPDGNPLATTGVQLTNGSGILDEPPTFMALLKWKTQKAK